MRSKITDWLEALKAGDMPLEEVAEKLRDGALKRVDADEDDRPYTMAESLNDARPFRTGGFDEISRGLHMGLIDIDQYGILAEAAAGRSAEDLKSADAAPAPKKASAPAPKPAAPPAAEVPPADAPQAE